MSIFNCNNRCNSTCNRIPYSPCYSTGPMGPQGPTGPMGPRGAVGPQGPQGEAGVTSAIYASTGTATVAENSLIPLTQTAITEGSDMSVSGNALVLPIGSYLITANVSAYAPNITAPTDLSVGINANGIAIPNEFLEETAETATSIVNMSKTLLLNVSTDGTTISLVNTSGESLIIENAGLTAVEI